MFGYVRLSPDRLCQEDLERYRACYCGLCHTLGQRYGAAAQMILNYDLVFLAMLLADGAMPVCRKKRCLPHLIRGRCCCGETAALDTAADISVILTRWQLKDGAADHRFPKTIKYRLGLLALRRAYNKAKAMQPAFDRQTEAQLRKLSDLERQGCAVPDVAADTFAELLRHAADTEPDETRRRVLGELLYHLGRWIYLVDAADDMKEDWRSGSYNPWLRRYETEEGTLRKEDRARLAGTLDASIRRMAAAFELADFGCWRPIIESTVYEGLYAVGTAVLSGTFRKRAKERDKLIRKAGP